MLTYLNATQDSRSEKRGAVWDHFTLITFKYNNSTSLLSYYLYNLHAAVLHGANASSSQPTITAVLERRVCDNRKAKGITQMFCSMIEKHTILISTSKQQVDPTAIRLVNQTFICA